VRLQPVSRPVLRLAIRFVFVGRAALAGLAVSALAAKRAYKPEPGSIAPVHANGDEPGGLTRFSVDIVRGSISKPFEPLTAAAE
jgi:hypothetical protein